MKAPKNVLGIFLLIVIGSVATASAQVPGPPKDAGMPQSCELKEFEECKTGFETCRKDYDMYVEWSKSQCPNLAGVDSDKLKDYARTGTDVPKRVKPPKPPKRPRKPGDKPKPPKAPKVTVEVLVPLYGKSEPVAPNATCPNGSFKLPVGFDRNGNKKLDADEVLEKLQSGCNGKDGAPGKPGKPGRNGAHSYTTKTTRFTSDPACPAGGVRSTNWTDLNGNGVLDKGESQGDVVLCDGKAGKSGSSGRPGRDGSNTRIQVGLGMRHSGVVTAKRPLGVSLAPELIVEYWLSDTWEFEVGLAWASEQDRSMVVTGELCRRGLNSNFGFCIGGQYQAWNLVGNKALWESGFVLAGPKWVPVDSQYADVFVEAAPMVGFDGYDEQRQAAFGWTALLGASGKF
ncbi:MAG: hypothetical protein WC866_05185 [Patescibacteria group bacterium]